MVIPAVMAIPFGHLFDLLLLLFGLMMPVAYNLIVHSSFSDDHLVPAN
jgi:hypothetical protein